jgi:hypothetical protein
MHEKNVLAEATRAISSRYLPFLSDWQTYAPDLLLYPEHVSPKKSYI